MEGYFGQYEYIQLGNGGDTVSFADPPSLGVLWRMDGSGKFIFNAPSLYMFLFVYLINEE